MPDSFSGIFLLAVAVLALAMGIIIGYNIRQNFVSQQKGNRRRPVLYVLGFGQNGKGPEQPIEVITGKIQGLECALEICPYDGKFSFPVKQGRIRKRCLKKRCPYLQILVAMGGPKNLTKISKLLE